MRLPLWIIFGQVLADLDVGQPLLVGHAEGFGFGQAGLPGAHSLGLLAARPIVMALPQPGSRLGNGKDAGKGVEILAGLFPGWLNRGIDVVSNLLMFAVAALIAWRLYLGMSDKMSYSETTLVLQYPVWWSYAASMFGATVFVIVSAWCLGRAIADLSDHGEYHASEAVH